MSTFTHDPDALGTNVLSVALIGPEEQRRKAVAGALSGSQASVTREFASYPDLDDVPRLIESDYDVIIVELDSNPEHALDLVENICGSSSTTVMVYSARSDSELLVRCMRAGAREFLTQPIAPSTLAEAMVRASVRRPAPRPAKKAGGKLLVFLGAKGGSGVTTLASNFAVALAQESGQNVMLIDLGLPLGDAALDLGISGQFSTANALQNFSRLDANFLAKLLIKHSSGLSVLAAPDTYTPVRDTSEAVEKLLAVSRQEFDYVVVDAGSRLGSTSKTLIDGASTVYLVSQVNISELRNSNRLISEFFASGGASLEIVLNRFTPRTLGIDEESVTKALTRPPNWKIPSDYPAARRAQNAASALVLEDSAVSRVIRQMARTACGLPANPDKRKRFSLFG
ncbi:MAG TPA: AAA family ATPase [Acidobacteriaceae bacterium]|nr:AAA family ATPase [Acidobacteriaceae bacterium]